MGASTSRVALPNHSISWYRTPLSPEVSRRVHAKSDWQGLQQTVGFLATLLGCGALAVHCSYIPGLEVPTVCFSLLYGCVANFLINGMHELGHGSVFKTDLLNHVFLRVLSFLGWLHPDMFFSSHLRHHRYTQNAPDDLENPMPIRITLRQFFSFAFLNVEGFINVVLLQTVRAALGMYPTGHLGWRPDWEETCYPKGDAQARAPAMRWAQFMLLGHFLVAYASISNGCFLLPFLLSCGPFLNGWLFFLCNATQHVGLEAGAADFRKNTRTFYLPAFLSFLYWHMNWHIEHHMYANVPCYNLKALHAAIKHDLPRTPNGLFEVWHEISECLKRQETALSPKKEA
jgi:fatty acid desaturase